MWDANYSDTFSRSNLIELVTDVVIETLGGREDI